MHYLLGRRGRLIFGLAFVLLAALAGARTARAETILPYTTITTPTTWTLAGSPYIVTDTVDVWASLTIEPGVVVKFAANKQMEISNGGTLTAVGTAAKPIVFTSNAASPQPGDWGYVYFKPGSSGELAHCDISYGGKQSWWAQVYIDGASNVTVRNCRIHDGATDGIRLYTSGEIIRPTLRDLVIENNAMVAINANSVVVQPVYDNLTLRNNGQNGVAFGLPNIGGGATLGKQLTLDGRGLNGAPFFFSTGLFVDESSVLTVTPGTELRFSQDQQLYVSGRLVAVGTAPQPITFTAMTTPPQPGDWKGLHFRFGSSGELAQCDIGYGGRQRDEWSQLYIETSALTVSDCRIHHGGADGIRVVNSGELVQPTLRDLVIEDNTLLPIHNYTVLSHPVYDNVTLRNNGWDIVWSGGGSSNGKALTYDSSGINGAPFGFEGDLHVDGGSVITVTPGTELRFAEDRSLTVWGGSRLYAVGTATQPITLTAATADPAPGDWYGLIVRWEEGSSLELAYCDVGYGGGSRANIFLYGRDVRVDHCRIHHSSVDGIRTASDQIHPLTFNTITDNGRCAVSNENSSIGGQQQVVILRNNTLAGNPCGISNESLSQMDARRNWWGDPSGPNHPTLNPGGKGVSVSDNVLFDPWLSAVPGSVLFEPAQGGNAGATTVRFWGVPADGSWSIVLRRDGQPDIPGVYRGPAPDDGVDYTFNLGGAAPGSGQFVATGPGAAAIPGSFAIVPAPPDARLEASNSISVTINARIRTHVGQAVPVFINFTNNGLVDAPPTEFTVDTAPGLTALPSRNNSYVVANRPPDIWAGVLSGPGSSQVGFYQEAMRPRSTGFTPVMVVPYVVGVYTYSIQYLSSDSFSSNIEKIRSAPMELSNTLQSKTDTELEMTFQAQGSDFNGTGTFSIERLGPTEYFTPTVEVSNNGGEVVYRFTAAVPARAGLSAAGADAPQANFEQVQQIIRLSNELNKKLSGHYYLPFIQSELQQLQRISRLGCLSEAGAFDVSQPGDQALINELDNLGDMARLSSALTSLVNTSPYDVPNYYHLLDAADASLNELWNAKISQNLRERLTGDGSAKYDPLRQILKKYTGKDPLNGDAGDISEEDLLRAINEFCYKREPKKIRVVTGAVEAYDPNDKSGNAGEGAQHYVYPDETLSYAIGFENMFTATAPASVVVISDTLDATKLDLSTLKLRLQSFGETMVPAGAGQLPFFTEVDLRPAKNLIVRIEADMVGNTLVWRFTSIDPATGDIPEDPLNGFLPPNRDGIEGQGYVYFTVEPKPGLQVGDVISNKATIVFDSNAPIDTPTWTNTVWNGPQNEPAWGLYLPLVTR